MHLCSDFWVNGCEIELNGLLGIVFLIENKAIYIGYLIYDDLILSCQNNRTPLQTPKPETSEIMVTIKFLYRVGLKGGFIVLRQECISEVVHLYKFWIFDQDVASSEVGEEYFSV